MVHVDPHASGCRGRPPTTLADADLQARLDELGYAVVPLLDRSRVNQLREIDRRFGAAPGDPQDGVHNDSWATDREYKVALSRRLREVLCVPIQRHFTDQRVLGWSRIVKWPGPRGAVVSHRDPTFVNERRFRSVGVWIALDDVGPEDGPLHVVSGSHRTRPIPRAHQAASNLCPEIDDSIDELAVTLPLTAGEAIVYDHALVHGSRLNRTHVRRTAVVGLLVPVPATSCYSVITSVGELVTVEVAPSFFLDHQLDALDADVVASSHRALSRW